MIRRIINHLDYRELTWLESIIYIFDTHSTKPAQKSDPRSSGRSLSSPPVPLHLYKVGLVPVSDCTGGNLPAVPLQPSSTITHSKESTCLTTTCNPSKLLKPRRMFKPHHAKMASVLLQLHGVCHHTILWPKQQKYLLELIYIYFHNTPYGKKKWGGGAWLFSEGMR